MPLRAERYSMTRTRNNFGTIRGQPPRVYGAFERVARSSIRKRKDRAFCNRLRESGARINVRCQQCSEKSKSMSARRSAKRGVRLRLGEVPRKGDGNALGQRPTA